jgi:mRNA-decapping enzyme 1B|eukprot:Transcript_5667.p1 GENE.Transcript_5667~~Transcript_5667.p1  ORF type:complete len:282 (-),score=107.63 Transcript_5667:277-1122(-)
MASLDKEKQLEYNLAVLKRRDAAISGVVDMSGHVVLYRFSEETQAWDRRNVEGSLFVVSRSEEPKYQFVVLNRISSENLIESVTSDFQMELTDQFLLYRNEQQEISGIWFYSANERASIAELLQSIVGGAQPTAAAAAAAAAATPAEPASTAVTEDAAPANNVAQFFSMAAAAQQAAPPMPTPEAIPAPAATIPAQAAPKGRAAKAKTATPTSASPAPPDVAALKAALRTKLSSLLNDDAFMDVLVQEYLTQQQQQQGGTGAAASGDVPDHLQALFKKMQA